MRHHIRSLAVVLCALIGAASARAQYPYYNPYPPISPYPPASFNPYYRPPPLSPYLNLNNRGNPAINYFNFVFFTLFILFATRSLHVRPATLGLVLGAGAVGGVLGSFVTGRVSRRIGVGPTFALGCVVFPAPLLLVPAAGGPKWLVLAMLFASEFGSGLGVMMLDIAYGSISAAIVPARLRSRVSGAFMVVNYGVRPLGSITAGALGSWIGVRPTLWIATIGALAGILWLLPSPVFGLIRSRSSASGSRATRSRWRRRHATGGRRCGWCCARERTSAASSSSRATSRARDASSPRTRRQRCCSTGRVGRCASRAASSA